MLVCDVLTKLNDASTAAQRKIILTGFIRELLADFLEFDNAYEIADEQNFSELGADSMQAVDFKVKLEELLKCSLRSTLLFDYPRLDLLTDFLLNEVLYFPADQCFVADNDVIQEPQLKHPAAFDDIAIIAMAGLFPGVPDVDNLWDKIVAGKVLDLGASYGRPTLDFGRVAQPDSCHAEQLGITPDAYSAMDRQEQLFYKVMADAFCHRGIALRDFAKETTGVFIVAQQAEVGGKAAYQIPIAHRVSFHLNLKGPSETINAFCTSAYVALHRAMQSLQLGECKQAIVGGVNVIAAHEFEAAANQGLYCTLLSNDNKTKSFSDDANGYVRSEGAGALILKPLARAEQDGNTVLAIVRSSAVFHGGRGYSFEAPNPQGLRETIRLCLETAGISSDSIDYVEAHGIGNVLADALELGAINESYRQLSTVQDKQWHVSCIKPNIGHPEIASGLAALFKVIKALEHNTLPGITGFGALNNEVALNHALILQVENQHWHSVNTPKRAALNSYAIGGMNAHIVLEEYVKKCISTSASAPNTAKVDWTTVTDVNEAMADNAVISRLVKAIFNLELASIELSSSLIDYGFDSIKVMQFVIQLNEALGLDIKISQVLSVDNFADLFALVARQQQQKSSIGASNRLPQTATEQVAVQSPLSEVQKGLWYVNQIAPNSIAFNVPLTFKVAGGIEQNKLRQALTAMLEAYPLLRACIEQPPGSAEIIQRIRPVRDCVNLQVIHATSALERDATLWSLLKQPFDLAKDPLLRLYIIETTLSEPTVFFVIHHSVFDGTSGALFIAAFWEKYWALVAGKSFACASPDLAFLEYVRWERAYLESSTAQEDQAWWRSQLSTQSPTINLPYDRLPQASLTIEGIGCQKFMLDEARLSKLKQLAATLKTNLSVLFLSVFQVFLHKLAQEEDIAVTVPVRGRPKQAFENSIGCYINVMVIPCAIVTELTFAALVQSTRQQFLHCLDHANYPFPRLLADLGLTLANPKENPFPVSYTYQNFFDELLNNAATLQDVETMYDIYQQTEDNYTLEIYDFRQSLQVNFKYKRSLFDAATILRHTAYFRHLLDRILAEPEQAIKHLELLPAEEKQRLLQDFNATHVDYPQHLCWHELFARQVVKHPENIAVISEGRQLTYRQLHEKSTALAVYLQQCGVKPDSLVALCVSRSFEMIIALLGILKAGAAYLPIAADIPAERSKILLVDSGARLLLTEQALAGNMSEIISLTECRLIVLDSEWEVIEQGAGEPVQELTPENLAYVIYTSGSTGQPKGVMVEHRQLVNHNLAVIDAYRLTALDRVLQFSTISFDIFVEEVFPTLLAGAALVLMEDNRFSDVHYFKETITKQQVSLVNLPTAFWHTLAEEDFSAGALTRVVIGGEKAEMEKFNRWRKVNPGIQVINTYGPTETTVISLLYPIAAELSHSAQIPLGTPLANTQIYVLDTELNPVPMGVHGELHIAGSGVARGYLNQPQLTAEKFIPNPFGVGKLYKTGDLVRWLNIGTLDYLGRSDDQVKIRGFRVELGEIERVLLTHPQVAQAVVIAQSHAHGKQLIVFYQTQGEVTEPALASHLRQFLPDYMQPSAWVRLAQLPLTGNGKINRKQLQSRTVDIAGKTPFVAPTNALEATLAGIWREVLGISTVGIHDNFFALGGHSLLAIQIVLRISQQLGVNISLSVLFEAADIEQLAVIVARSEKTLVENTLTRFAETSEELLF